MAEELGKVCTSKGSNLKINKIEMFIVLCVLCPKVGYFLDRPRKINIAQRARMNLHK